MRSVALVVLLTASSAQGIAQGAEMKFRAFGGDAPSFTAFGAKQCPARRNCDCGCRQDEPCRCAVPSKRKTQVDCDKAEVSCSTPEVIHGVRRVAPVYYSAPPVIYSQPAYSQPAYRPSYGTPVYRTVTPSSQPLGYSMPSVPTRTTYRAVTARRGSC